jgi:ABC-2 type transport system permease protein
MRLLSWQLRWEQVAYWRNPQAAFFTFAFPLMFLAVFASLNAGHHLSEYGGISYNQYFIPAILAFGLMSACYSNLAMGLTERRENGALKRLRTTPLPAWALVGGMLLSCIVVTVLLAILTVGAGVLFYSVHLPYHVLPLIAALALGAVTFCALGIAISTYVPNADAAPAIVQFPFFLLNFISGVFFPAPTSGFLHDAAQAFPLVHLVNASFAAFDPRVTGSGFRGGDLLVLALWAVGSTAIAVRRFRWEPKR